MRTILYLVCLIFLSVVPQLQSAEPVDVDLLLRGGSLIDGTGKPVFVGDVGIQRGKIVAVGQFEVGQVGKSLDCSGLTIVPGFIDLHNHSDFEIIAARTRACINYLTQGCTTIVTGNCGSGPVDTGAYYKQMDQLGMGVNVAHLLPQGSLRREVMGLDQREASNDEIERMRTLAEKAMQDGAGGMSSGLIYVPSSYADTNELAEIAKVVGKYGGIYASHIRNENLELLTAINEAIQIGQRSGCPVHVSHFKASGQDAWGMVRAASEIIEAARKNGHRVTADQYPYAASSTSLEASVIPTWARAGGEQKLLERLANPDQNTRIHHEIEKKLKLADGGERFKIARYAKNPAWAGRDIAAIASQRQVPPLDIVLEITKNGGASIVNFGMNEQDVRFVMTLPWVATASDGRAYVPGADVPHPRSYGTFSRKIGYYAIREKQLSLEQAIHSASGLPAEILGLTDRGKLEAGLAADIVVFDSASFIDTATYESPHRYSTGVRHVIINGDFAILDGTPTGTLSGKVLRKR